MDDEFWNRISVLAIEIRDLDLSPESKDVLENHFKKLVRLYLKEE